MLINHRDLHILDTVAKFSMLPAGAIRKLIFPDNRSNTSCDEALLRLVDRKYLARVERRLIGGNGGGSGQYVYKLGTQGRKVVQSQRTARLSDIHHTIAVADAYVDFKELERAGRLTILGYAAEPDSWVLVGGAELRPDLHIEVGIKGIATGSKGIIKSYFIEVDMGHERQKQLKEKLAAYSTAYKYATEEEVGSFPRVQFLVTNDERVKELKWLISKEPEPELFSVARQDQLASVILDDDVALTTT
jgi:hypothetical protein